MTKREKVLIIIALSVVVLYVALNFLIMPAYTAFVEETAAYDELLYQKMEMDMKLQTADSVTTGYERVSEEHAAAIAPFPEEMSNYDLDKLITGICFKHNIIPTSLDILSDADADSWQSITAVYIKVSAVADYRDLQNLINTVNKTHYIQISSLNYKKDPIDETITVDIEFIVQMLNTSEPTPPPAVEEDITAEM